MKKYKTTIDKIQKVEAEMAYDELKEIMDGLRSFTKTMKNGGGSYGLGIPVFIRCVARNLYRLAEQLEKHREKCEVVDDEQKEMKNE